jgi:hypothetical protein
MKKCRKRRCKKCEYLVVGNDTVENLSLSLSRGLEELDGGAVRQVWVW